MGGGWRASSRVEGNKNSALPLIAACLLTDQECVLHNVPRIRDVGVLLDLAARAGRRRRGCRHVDAADPLRARSPPIGPIRRLVGKLRGSVLLLGPLLARRGSARLAQPGGDFPARRTITTHLQALIAMGGCRRCDEPGHALARAGRTDGASLYLDEASVTGTETALLAAAAAQGTDRDPARGDGAARRRALPVPARRWGSVSRGRERRRIRVEAPRGCRGATHTLAGDYIEAGSWGVVAAITGRRDRSRRAHGPRTSRSSPRPC